MSPWNSLRAEHEGRADPLQALHSLRPLKPFALLESAQQNPRTGTRSWMGLGPQVLGQIRFGEADALGTMQRVLAQWQSNKAPGAFGTVFLVFSYEWKNALESLPQTAVDNLGFPDAVLLGCRDLLVWDHPAGRLTSHCAYDTQDPASRRDAMVRRETLRDLLCSGPTQTIPVVDPHGAAEFPAGWQANMSKAEFLAKVHAVQGYIAGGDIYQANLSQQFRCRSSADGKDLYAALRQINPSPFSGYMRWGPWELISCSPERLLRKRGEDVATRPIAGTRPRGMEPGKDRRLRQELLLSPKERAEHIMLVDLERNDLGRVCQQGSVCVDEMMVVESYSHVQHIVSNVRGTLSAGTSFADILKAVFPGGTITGVPKIRCMEILDELEPTVRGPYTGSFGYMDSDGDFDLCIAIRTLLKRGRGIFVQAGAGIVADSDPEAEYQEGLQKAKAMALATQCCSVTMEHV